MAVPDLMLDPCGRAVALRALRDLQITGSLESQIRTRTTDSEEEVRLFKGDAERLDAEIQKAEVRCAEITGNPSPNARRVLRGGAIGTGCGVGWPWWTS